VLALGPAVEDGGIFLLDYSMELDALASYVPEIAAQSDRRRQWFDGFEIARSARFEHGERPRL
jgi:hypothetical protein